MAQIAPLYARITNPRNTDNGQGTLPSVRDLYKGLSLSSQFKVSLFLNRNNRNADDLDGHLTRCGIFDEYSASSYSYDFFASEAILPGANFDMTEQPGSYQGMLEYAPTRRIWPDFEVSYYIDKNYNLLRLFEEWMNYINPLYGSEGKYIGGTDAQVGFTGHNSYYRMKYPGKYKRTIAVTKFERDFWENPNQIQDGQTPQQMISYQLIDAFPKQVTAVPVTYDGSTVTKVTVIFGYTRYITHKNNGTKTSAFGSTNNTGKNKNYRVNKYLPPSIDFEYAQTSGDVKDVVKEKTFEEKALGKVNQFDYTQSFKTDSFAHKLYNSGKWTVDFRPNWYINAEKDAYENQKKTNSSVYLGGGL